MFSRPQIRKFFDIIFRDDSYLDAFCIDYFPHLYRVFSGPMDRITKINILLSRSSEEDLSRILLSEYPDLLQGTGEASNSSGAVPKIAPNKLDPLASLRIAEAIRHDELLEEPTNLELIGQGNARGQKYSSDTPDIERSKNNAIEIMIAKQMIKQTNSIDITHTSKNDGSRMSDRLEELEKENNRLKTIIVDLIYEVQGLRKKSQTVEP